jgi:hypothetical protein
VDLSRKLRPVVAWVSKPLNEDKSQFRASFGGEPSKNWGLTFFNETWYEYNTKNSLIPLNQWSFVVITVDQVKGEIKMYVDGKEAESLINKNKLPSSSHPWYIGYQVDDKYYFDGKIDELSFYQRILSPEEVLSLFKME